jgi:hypothetical protein
VNFAFLTLDQLLCQHDNISTTTHEAAPMDRNLRYKPPTLLLDGEDDDEIAPWEAERLAREAMHRDPDPIGPDRLVSARNPEVQRVSSLGLGRRHEFCSDQGGDNSLGLTASFTGGDNSLRLEPSPVGTCQ